MHQLRVPTGASFATVLLAFSNKSLMLFFNLCDYVHEKIFTTKTIATCKLLQITAWYNEVITFQYYYQTSKLKMKECNHFKHVEVKIANAYKLLLTTITAVKCDISLQQK